MAVALRQAKGDALRKGNIKLEIASHPSQIENWGYPHAGTSGSSLAGSFI